MYKYHVNIEMVRDRQIEIESETPLTAVEITIIAEKKALLEYGDFDYSLGTEVIGPL